MCNPVEVTAAELTLAINRKLLELVTTRDRVLERLSQIEDYIDALRDDYGEREPSTDQGAGL